FGLPSLLCSRPHRTVSDAALLEPGLGSLNGRADDLLCGPAIVLAEIAVRLLAGRNLEEREQEMLPSGGMAIVAAFVVPAVMGGREERDARLPQLMRPRLARHMGNREGVLDRDDVVLVEHRAPGPRLEDDEAVAPEQGRDLLKDVAHGGVAVFVELVHA